ncbi:MAG: hypothetical protein HZB39_09855 [Planctomycetes bacterium]|nr:hypothetical protein [Planctomycetota bacterium]
MATINSTTGLLAVLFASSLAAPALAQFGGDGADGVFHPTSSVAIDTSARPGGWSFTSIDIPAGVDVRFGGAHPALLRCRGAASIAGRLIAGGFDANGAIPGAGGPGGFAGGAPGNAGLGPAGGAPGSGNTQFRFPAGNGGHASPGIGAPGSTSTYGSAWTFDLRGGSGGGGFRHTSIPQLSLGGAGGGGVIALLCDGDIDVSGAILANGAGNGREGSGAGGGVLLRSAADVRVGGTIEALGPRDPFGLGFMGGDGFVRIDAWGAPPVFAPSAIVAPAAIVLALPALRAGEARIGQAWSFDAACVPGDDLAFFWSPGATSIAMPGLGLLELDPVAGIFLLATAHAGGEPDPSPGGSIAVPSLPGLIGTGAHLQAIAVRVASPEGPRLSNGVHGAIR